MLGFSRHAEQRTPFSALLRALIMLVFGHLWWTENVVYGNAVSLRALGWFASTYTPLQDYALPALPSMFQLFITEDFGGLLSTPAMGFVSIIFGLLDVIGPAYGWLIRQGILVPTGWQLAQALVRGVFVSVLAQHIAWVNAKWLWGYLRRDLWGRARRGRDTRAAKQPDPTPKRPSRRARQSTTARSATPQAPTPRTASAPAEEAGTTEVKAAEAAIKVAEGTDADLVEIQWQNGAFTERR